jgi:hypothetical protein
MMWILYEITRSWREFPLGISWIIVLVVLLFSPVFGADRHESSSGDPRSRESTGMSKESPVPEQPKTETDQSPIIGDGVRTPPDIGAAGTATPTPPVRSESPTDEPDMLPSISPGLPQPSDSSIAPLDEGESSVVSPTDKDKPLGQPDFPEK